MSEEPEGGLWRITALIAAKDVALMAGGDNDPEGRQTIALLEEMRTSLVGQRAIVDAGGEDVEVLIEPGRDRDLFDAFLAAVEDALEKGRAIVDAQSAASWYRSLINIGWWHLQILGDDPGGVAQA